jgi:hypothetical protein
MKLNEQSIPLLLEHPIQDNIVQHIVRADGLRDPWAPKYITRKLPLREVMEAGSFPTMKLGGLGEGKSHISRDGSFSS